MKKTGAIEAIEIQAFKHRTIMGGTLKCFKPRRKCDEDAVLMNMVIESIHPFVVRLLYRGKFGTCFKTSMTWAEAVILNRMTPDELTAEVCRMLPLKTEEAR